MPFGDRTGPQGMGPTTGRGAGFCTGFTQLGWGFGMRPRRFFGRDRGMFQAGMGRGPGMPQWKPDYDARPEQSNSQGNELEFLKARAEAISAQLGDIQQRIAEIEKE